MANGVADLRPPVDPVLQANILPTLVQNLTANPQANGLILESAWALTSIASTDKTFTMVEAGAVAPLAQLLLHAAGDIRKQAAWCIGNIASDNQEYRDSQLQQGILEPL